MAEALERPSLLEFVRRSKQERISWAMTSPGLTSSRFETARIFVYFCRIRTCVPGMLAFYLACVILSVPMSWTVAAGLLIAFCYSAAANLFNAYTDVVEDNENMPSRVYLLGLIGRRRLLASAYLVSASMIAAAVVTGRPFFIGLTVLCIAVAHQYSMRPLRAKARPFVSVLIFSLDVGLPFLLGGVLAGRETSTAERSGFVAIGVYLVLWFSAKALVKNLPDFEGDEAAGLRTTATIFGSRHKAGVWAAGATAVVYASPLVLVLLGLIDTMYLATLLWLPVVGAQCWRMVNRLSAQASNNMLRSDMWLSIGYLMTWIVLTDASLSTVAVLAVAVLTIVIADGFQLDTRRTIDVASKDSGFDESGQ